MSEWTDPMEEQERREMEWEYEDSIKREVEELREKVERQARELTLCNDALRQRNGELRAYKSQADRFCVENAKLRELVRDMYKLMDASCQHGHPIFIGTMAHVKNRAKGLGIEVD